MIMQNIPTGLQALMQASAVLQNTAAPTAPGPQGQQPTVANRVMQQGMAQAGKQAGIANAMMMQKAQQQQRMAQDPQAVAQMAAQMLKQGVGGLPVNMQFKDGGIVGFQEGGSPSGLPGSSMGLELGEPAVAGEIAKPTQEQVNQIIGEIERARGRKITYPEYLDVVSGRLGAPTPPVVQAPQSAPQAAPAPAPRVAPQAVPSPRTAPPPKEEGIAGLQAQLAGLQGERPVAPTIDQVASQAKGIVPSPEAGIERIRDIYSQREKAIEGMPNLEREGIAALEEAKAARKALLEKRKQDDAYDTLRAFFRGLYTRGNDFDVARMGIKARDEQDALADLNHANSILKLRQAEQARQLGKFDRQEALEKDALNQMDKYSDNVAKSMQVTGTLLGNVYNTDAKFVSDTLNRQAQQLIELAKLKQQYEQQNDTRQVQRITALQGQLTNALRNVNSKVDEKYKNLLMIVNGPGGAQAIDKDPNLQKQFGDYRKELETARAEFNIPQLEQVLQSEISRYTGVQSNVLRFDRDGNPVQ